jgi:hypothetical protein
MSARGCGGQAAGAVNPGGQRICAVASAAPPQAALADGVDAADAGAADAGERTSPLHPASHAVRPIMPIGTSSFESDTRIVFLHGWENGQRHRRGGAAGLADTHDNGGALHERVGACGRRTIGTRPRRRTSHVAKRKAGR